MFRPCVLLVWLLLAGGCTAGPETPRPGTRASALPSILLVTLDTTRADVMRPEIAPAFTALAARGRRFTQAYSTVPETLPAHVSMMTGLYPGGHGIHENARVVRADLPLLSERLQSAGYRTAAFVSSFVLARRFGLARGFEVYDDELGDAAVERGAAATTARAAAFLTTAPADRPLFVWVHYFDPHAPYEPSYEGEVQAMDRSLHELIAAFDGRKDRAAAIVVAADHGEGLGDHGEAQHGHLLYQSTMHVPLAIAGPGVAPGTSDAAVSIRQIFHTVLDWAGVASEHSLRQPAGAVVLGEAMKPFLSYGWQPQVMAVADGRKAIHAGTTEFYDLAADPREARDLASSARLPDAIREALADYPIPEPSAAASAPLTDEARERLASLGYVSSSTAPVVRRDAPRPADMVHLLEVIERASTLFVQQQYAAVIPLLDRILAQDPYNLDAALRLATAHSSLGHDQQAIDAFTRASSIAPQSPDVRTYLALHYVRTANWARAVPLLEQVLAQDPARLPALEALALVRQRDGRLTEAIALRQKIYALRSASAAEWVQLGELAMAAEQTAAAITAFERARLSPPGADRPLELGVLYLAAGRLADARAALDRVPSSHPEYSMALFKRAQVSVLLNEPDRAARIALARQHADRVTRPLIEREALFRR